MPAYRSSLLPALLLFMAAGCGSTSGNDEPASDDAQMTLPAPELAASEASRCDSFEPGQKQVYWGDMHVHTSISLDAYAFGTVDGPEAAFAYARGEPVQFYGDTIRLERPLDFTAVTDHAEWMDLMYICTEPENANDLYCQNLTAQKSNPLVGAQIFQGYVVPTITQAEPQRTPICVEDPERCLSAAANQWQRAQDAANAADDPCNFTALIGYEWSATPSYSHTHRNIIFRNENVTQQAIDYIRYPSTTALWEQLEAQCLPEDDCDVIAVPHNTNMGDGVSFDVETETDAQLLLRAKYERLIEIHQDKGNSECLPEIGATDENDCNFELYLTNHSQATRREDFSEEDWNATRSSYVRSLLLRGLAAYDKNPELGNPLQLGIIGSTDTHSATPGRVEENGWRGEAFSQNLVNVIMSRPDYNPGGLVAVWAEENTRDSIFTALKNREVYGTSGPRIEVQFKAATAGEDLSCTSDLLPGSAIPMGGEFTSASEAPTFIVQSRADRDPLAEIEIIKGTYQNGDVVETVQSVWSDAEGERQACAIWTDPDFDPAAPSFWYARVKETPTKRWSQTLCEEAGNCDRYPDVVSMIQERAWASPIWYLPVPE